MLIPIKRAVEDGSSCGGSTSKSLLRVSVSPPSSDNLIPNPRLVDDKVRGIKKQRHVFSSSPVSIASIFGFYSLEAPARLQTDSGKSYIRTRSASMGIETEDVFCKLDTSLKNILSADLPTLVNNVDSGLKAGIAPVLVDNCLGGTYFLRDANKSICVVFKPSDEEPFAPNNPRQGPDDMGKHKPAYKGGILPGFGMFRELAAFALDEGFAGVPPTHISKVRHQSFNHTNDNCPYKIGSVQSFVRSICTAEDMGPSLFDLEDIQRIAVLDIVMCNLDRHSGNILVCHSNPYQIRKYQMPKRRALFSDEISKGYAKFPSSPPIPEVASSAPAHYSPFLQTRSFNQGRIDESDSVSESFSSEPSVNSSSTRRYRLVPIDHGYCLPHILHIDEVNFTWMEWSESTLPLSPYLRAYIAQIDPDLEAERLRRVVGAGLQEEALLTLKVCTTLLQEGIAAGLSLRGIGELMTSDGDEMSTLKKCVVDALNRSVKHCMPARIRSPGAGQSENGADTLQRSQSVAGGISLSSFQSTFASLSRPFPNKTADREAPIDLDHLSALLSAYIMDPDCYRLMIQELECAVKDLVRSTVGNHN